MECRRIILFFTFSLNAVWSTDAQPINDWRNIKSVEDVCESYPELMIDMLEQYDLERPD